MKFLDLFSGIGGFRFGMEYVGHECVGYVEKDKYARKSYEAIHDTEGEWTRHDIREVTDEEWRELHGTVDVICGGFPCQAFSVAGRRGGFEDTRGTMFFEIARATKQIKPRFLFLENVKGLLSHDKGNTFGTILHTLDELGYDVEWEVCNSKNFGVAQNRERVFIIGHLRGASTRKVFPIGRTDEKVGREIVRLAHYKGFRRMHQTFDTDGSCESLDTMQGGGRQPCVAQVKGDQQLAIPVSSLDRFVKCQNGRRFKDDGDPMFTITTQDRHGVMVREATKTGFAVANEGDSINLTAIASKTRRGRVGKGVANTLDTGCSQGVLEGYRIRKLTPKECFRLQAFPDWAFERAAEVNSNAQLYKQVGNAVTVSVVKVIAERLEG